MPRKRFLVLFSAVLIALTALSAFGQGTTATLTGTVTSGGAPLPGVSVTASSPSLQGTRTVVTGEAGGYNMPGLPPGRYTVSFELPGMQRVQKTTVLSLAQTSRVDADLIQAAVAEAITVTATAPAILETNEVARNFTLDTVEKLPVARTIRDTVLLAPGVQSSGVNNQITISGAPSYDNLFLVNGVVVNENLRGQPHTLFIEDAIQETTVLTGSISAEYGRFTGGVVSTLTKSGGNEFSGSFRDTLTNSNWRAKTPWPSEADHVDKIDQTYEATLGGFILRDRLWFFAAGRQLETSDQRFTRETNVPYVFGVDEKRMEGKLTGQITTRHNVVGSYLRVDRTEANNAFQNILDANTIDPERMLPNTLMALQYNGVWSNNLLFEAQFSQKRFTFESSGGNDTSRVGGTWLYDLGRLAFANAPVFCGVCDNDEKRDNDSFVAKATYFMNTASLGTHNVSAGLEDYAETRVSNNYQSASLHEIYIGGGHVVGPDYFPRFDTGTTVRYRPIFELSPGTDFQTRSAFINDRWDLNQHFSFNIGVRYDVNDGTDASGNLVSDDSAFSPRLGVMYDVRGDGRHRINAYYGSYVTKIADGNVGGSGQAAGNPSLYSWTYRGPVINPAGTPASQLVPTRDALARVFEWFDSIGGINNRNSADGYLGSSISGYVTEFPDSIASPAVDELSLGYGVQVGRSGVVRIDGIQRKWKNFYAAHLDMTTGTKTDPEGFVGDLAYTINEDSETERDYKGVQLFGTWRPGRWNIGGGYTWSELKGNDAGEGAGTATIRNLPLSTWYPEYLNYEERRPTGFLPQDQTHVARVWVGYSLPTPIGTFDMSLLQRYESGKAYSALGTIDASGRSTPYAGAPTNPGYRLNQLGTTHDYFFGDRGEYRTEDEHNTDLSLFYTLPIRNVAIFANAIVVNALDNDAVINPNQTVITRRTGGAASGLVVFNPFTDSPVECPQGSAASACSGMGAHWQKGVNFGKPVGVASYQIPREYRFTMGIRF
jgi:outer membrane receptor for ferrienterochelin and colicin